MSKKFDWMSALAVTAGFIIFWLFIDREDKKAQIKKLEKEIDDHKNLNKEIKNKLKELIENNKEVDPEISNELGQIAALIEIKQDTKAMLSLVKIIENLLQRLYEKDGRLKQIAMSNGRKRPAFMDYLQLAQEDKHISKEDFHLISVAKMVRDEEAHELDVEKEKGKIVGSFLSGMAIVLTLCRIIKNRPTA